MIDSILDGNFHPNKKLSLDFFPWIDYLTKEWTCDFTPTWSHAKVLKLRNWIHINQLHGNLAALATSVKPGNIIWASTNQKTKKNCSHLHNQHLFQLLIDFFEIHDALRIQTCQAERCWNKRWNRLGSNVWKHGKRRKGGNLEKNMCLKKAWYHFCRMHLRTIFEKKLSCTGPNAMNTSLYRDNLPECCLKP